MEALSTYDDPAIETTAQRWMAALDCRTVSGAEPWTLHVIGVHEDARELWMQVAPADDVTASIVLRISPQATPAHVLASLERDRPRGETYPRIIDVMRLL